MMKEAAFLLAGYFISFSALAAPLPATGIQNAKSVECSGRSGQFFINFPDITFSTNQYGQVIVDAGTACVGYKYDGQTDYIKFLDSNIPRLNDGPAIIFQTFQSNPYFTAFVYIGSSSDTSWITGTGDFGSYSFGGSGIGTMKCRFYQAQLESCQ